VKTGVMIRESGAGNAKEIALLYQASFHAPNSTKSLTLQTRATTGGAMASIVVPDVKLPVKLRLVRAGNTFSPTYSSDSGVTWIPVGKPQTMVMEAEVQAGIAVGGNQNNYQRLSRSNLSNVTVDPCVPQVTAAVDTLVTGQTIRCNAGLINTLTESTLPTDPITWLIAEGGGTIDSKGVYTAPALVGTGSVVIKAEFGGYSATKTFKITLPSPWTLPILQRTPRADAGLVSEAWTLVGGGMGISTQGKQDLFQFLPTEVSGNQTITVKLDQSNGTQAGIAFRDPFVKKDRSPGTNSRYASIWRTPAGLEWATREETGKAAGSRAQAPTTTLPIWLRLSRTKTTNDTFTFSASYSTDGVDWTGIGGPRVFSMDSSGLGGLVIASGSATSTATAIFSNLSIDSNKSSVPSSSELPKNE
jgi:hypothetical protein